MSNAMIATMARHIARERIKTELRWRGERISKTSASEIRTAANKAYRSNPDLYNKLGEIMIVIMGYEA
jgi:hypothetical protein